MCAETAYLIELTAAFLRDEPVTLRPDMDYRKLCGIAKAHNLIAVVYAVCNKAPNTEVIPEDCRSSLYALLLYLELTSYCIYRGHSRDQLTVLSYYEIQISIPFAEYAS